MELTLCRWGDPGLYQRDVENSYEMGGEKESKRK